MQQLLGEQCRFNAELTTLEPQEFYPLIGDHASLTQYSSRPAEAPMKNKASIRFCKIRRRHQGSVKPGKFHNSLIFQECLLLAEYGRETFSFKFQSITYPCSLARLVQWDGGKGNSLNTVEEMHWFRNVGAGSGARTFRGMD